MVAMRIWRTHGTYGPHAGLLQFENKFSDTCTECDFCQGHILENVMSEKSYTG